MAENITEYFTDVEKYVLNKISTKIQQNNQAEAMAIVGYNEQLKIIQECKEILIKDGSPNQEMILNYLNVVDSATREKISDELNHSKSLLDEYVEFTGIKIAEN